MKILILAPLPPGRSTTIGRTVPLAEELQKRGHTIRIATLRDGTETDDSLFSFVGPSLKIPRDIKFRAFEIIKRIIIAKKGFESAVKFFKPDLVVLEKAQPQNVLAKIPKNIPIVLDVDDDERYSSGSSFLWTIFISFVESYGVKKADLITACSPALVKRFKAEFIPTGISAEEGSPAPDIRQKFGIPPDAQIITYLGSLSLASGHRIDHILSIWEKLAENFPKVRLVFIGDGNDAEKIKKLKHFDRIHFYGRYDANHSESFAKQSTILIDPVDNSRVSESKSSSRAILALKTGTPVVAGNVGIRKIIIPESLHEWTLYDPEKLNSFYECIACALKPESKNEFVQKTKDEWEKWSWPEIGSKFVSLIENL